VNGNADSTEQVYVTFENLLQNFLGFAVYMALLAAVNPLIMAVTVVTAIAGAIAREWVNRWEYANEDERTQNRKRMWFIARACESKYAKDIRLFGMVHWLQDVYESTIQLGYNFSRRLHLRHFAADVITAVAAFAREGFAYFILIFMVLDGAIAVDEFILLFAAVAGFSTWVGGILTEFSRLSRDSKNLCHVRNYLDYPETFRREDGVAIPQDNTIELKNVSFTYPGAEEPTLQNLNLKISPGEKLAVVGLNGAGKTTLVKLMAGLYDPTEGQISYGGQDVREFNRQEYYAMFTAVFQEFNILAISIADNIAQPLPQGESRDNDRIVECIRLAGLTDKIESLPNGIDTILVKDVHLGAEELSGGETQRLMLARALYTSTPILILDEPTAALDPIAESDLYNKYNELSDGRTSVYISHRLASTRFCDKIVLIDGKGIAEEGTHDTLMSINGKYKELFDIQSKYYQKEVVA
ncbi:MAG: ABC transporter ATP-binding protein/permease, partial [Defluviitaleaceae bacterium]|nr:ABC transporter ATP-binding protein/permease [Defluviitaleaceae bacterium]